MIGDMRSKCFGYSPVFLGAAFFLMTNCSQPKEVPATSAEEPIRSIEVPVFNPDSSYYFVEEQLAYGPRVPNSKGHRDCAEYLVAKLQAYGAEVVTQDFEEKAFDGTILQLRNIIAAFQPDKTKRIMLAAHWDSRPWADKETNGEMRPIDGANDNASGVAVLLEIARQISLSQPPEAGLDLIFFDGEDYGLRRGYQGKVWDEHDGWCLGSRYWSSNKHRPRYSAYYGILLDMVGAKDARFFQEGASMEYAPSVVRKVWNNANRIGFGDLFINSTKPPITDDHVFINQMGKIPTIDIVQFDPSINEYFGPVHHTRGDNLEIIDRNTLQAVGQTVLYTVYHE